MTSRSTLLAAAVGLLCCTCRDGPEVTRDRPTKLSRPLTSPLAAADPRAAGVAFADLRLLRSVPGLGDLAERKWHEAVSDSLVAARIGFLHELIVSGERAVGSFYAEEGGVGYGVVVLWPFKRTEGLKRLDIDVSIRDADGDGLFRSGPFWTAVVDGAVLVASDRERLEGTLQRVRASEAPVHAALRELPPHTALRTAAGLRSGPQTALDLVVDGQQAGLTLDYALHDGSAPLLCARFHNMLENVQRGRGGAALQHCADTVRVNCTRLGVHLTWAGTLEELASCAPLVSERLPSQEDPGAAPQATATSPAEPPASAPERAP